MVESERIGVLNKDHSFLKDNEFIRKGYRLNFSTTKRILKSLFMIHNESFNVWSHLLGVLLFLILILYSLLWLSSQPEGLGSAYLGLSKRASEYSDSLNLGIEDLIGRAKECEEQFEFAFKSMYSEAVTYEQRLADAVSSLYEDLRGIGQFNISEKYRLATYKLKNLSKSFSQKIDSYEWIDLYGQEHEHKIHKWPIFVFMASAMLCMMMSSMYHLFNAYSKKVNRFMSKLDYAGTSVLCMGSYYPAIYYPYFCESAHIYLYLGSNTVATCFVFFITLFPWFQKKSMRWFRGCIFLVLGLLGIIPFIHFLFHEQSHKFATVAQYFMLMAASYIIGVIIFINRVPERFFPGKFDFGGNSHNIWHLFVVAGTVFHYLGSLEAYHIRSDLPCPVRD